MHKKPYRMFAVLLCAVVMLTCFGVRAQLDDPVVAKSYLDEVLRPELEAQLALASDVTLSQTYAQKLRALSDAIGAYRLETIQSQTQPQRAQDVLLVKKGDVLTLSPGAKAMVISGSACVEGTTLVDVTAGVKAASGAAAAADTTYMQGGEKGGLQITSATAEIWLDGVYTLAASDETDYPSLALALHEMDLFRGTGYSYNLESGATRAESLVMFLRLLGLEDEAMAYTGTQPFTDVPQSHWSYRYVAYAYSLGLTNGTSPTTFSPDMAVTAQHYLTFLLRALHYAENTDFTFKTVVSDVVNLGLFSQNETAMLASGSFQRYQMVYASYYGLFGVDQSTGLVLFEQLVSSGSVSRQAQIDAICTVVGTSIA